METFNKICDFIADVLLWVIAFAVLYYLVGEIWLPYEAAKYNFFMK